MPPRLLSRRTLLVVGGLVAAAAVAAAVVVSAADDASPPVEVSARAERLPRQPRAAERVQRADRPASTRAAWSSSPPSCGCWPSEVQRPDTITVAAGDLIGASPAALGGVPRRADDRGARAHRARLASVGNHEFDEGADELLRMQNGGCHPQDGCADRRARTRVRRSSTCPPTRSSPPRASRCCRRTRSARCRACKIGFIGMTLEGTPDIVTQPGSPDWSSATRPRRPTGTPRELQQQGVQAIVVLLHEGGTQAATGGINDCVGLHRPDRRTSTDRLLRRRSTWWSAGTPTRPTTAASTASSSPAPARSGAWSPTSTCGSTRRPAT